MVLAHSTPHSNRSHSNRSHSLPEQTAHHNGFRHRLQSLKLDRATALALAFCVNAAVMIALSLPQSSDYDLKLLVADDPPDEALVARLIAPTQQEQLFDIPPPPTAPSRPIAPLPVLQTVFDRHILLDTPVEEVPLANSSTLSQSFPVTPSMATLSGAADREAGVAYGSTPLPIYPRDAARKGLQGTVLLRVLVSSRGSVLQVEIERSSGHTSLDRAALRQVASHWEFIPALRDGEAADAWVKVPLVFTLQGR